MGFLRPSVPLNEGQKIHREIHSKIHDEIHACSEKRRQKIHSARRGARTSENRSCAAVVGKLRCGTCTATFAFCGVDVIFYQKLRCNRRKTAVQRGRSCVSGKRRFPALSCEFQAPTYRLPRLGPAEMDFPFARTPNISFTKRKMSVK